MISILSEMITDRISADWTEAERIRSEKIGKDIPITAQDKIILERGFMTKQTLNRIETAEQELYQLLKDYGYMKNISIINKTNWILTDIPRKSDYVRILQNLCKLRSYYYVFNNTPEVPDLDFSYMMANDIEKILVDIDSILQNMIDSFRYLNTLISGEDNYRD